jgi:hypothetical protein
MKNYIPKNKSDFTAIEYLKSLPFEVVRSDIPKLLEWLQDLHWEIAHEVAPYLIPHVNEIKDDLLFILSTNDEEWKFNIIRGLIEHSTNKLNEDLIKVIRRIAERPTEREIESDVDWAAKKIIANKLLCD